MIYNFSQPLLVALAVACLGYWLATVLTRHSRSAAKTLAAYYAPPIQEEKKAVAVGSFEHRFRLAALRYHIDAAGKEKAYFYGVIAILSLILLALLSALGVPPALYLLAPAVAYLFTNSQVNGAWSKMRLAIEKELPTFLLRLAATLQATPNVMEAIHDVAESLDPSGPLLPWMQRMLAAMQSAGRKGLEEMQAEAASISPSLLIVVLEIGRLWETGGSGFFDAFHMAADNLASILEGRAQAAAKAGGAWNTIYIILGALGGSLVIAMSSAGGARLFATPAVQIGLLLTLVWAAVGWSVIHDMIREVAE